MNIPNRPKKIKYRPSQETVTSFSGLKFINDLASKLGILDGLKRLTVKKRKRGVPIDDFVMSVVNTQLIGGQHFTDLERLREETATRQLLYGLEVPAPTTAGETIRKFHVGHIKQLEGVIGDAIRRSDEFMGGDEPITLDMDSSIFEVHGYFKEGARYSFNHIKGFHPLLCFWAQKRLLVGVRLRAGNRRSDHHAVTFLIECLSRIPSGRRVIVRLDGGFYSRQNVEVMLKRELEFSISAHLNTALRREIEALPEDAWSAYPWEEETEWAEFSYQPDRWPRAFRLIVKRTPFFEGDQLVFGRYFYNAVITNRRGAGCSLFKHHFRRGGAENYIEEFKNGLGARMLPSQRFTANWAWLVISQLAYNLGQWFKLLLLPMKEQSQKFKTLRLHFWCVAGRLVRSGRRLILSIARAGGAVQRFMQIQSMILRL